MGCGCVIWENMVVKGQRGGAMGGCEGCDE